MAHKRPTDSSDAPLSASLNLLIGARGVGVALQVLPQDLCVGPGDIRGEVEFGHAPSERFTGHHDAVCKLRRAHKVLLPCDLVRCVDGLLSE